MAAAGLDLDLAAADPDPANDLGKEEDPAVVEVVVIGVGSVRNLAYTAAGTTAVGTVGTNANGSDGTIINHK